MFFHKQTNDKKKYYARLLSLIGSLSKMFSDSLTPYLYYRIAEIAFCRSFSAKDLSRSDVAVDASKNGMGIGLKTFLYKSGNSLEKVAEFNRNRNLYQDYIHQPEELIRIISQLRNIRIEYALNLHGLESSIYHWVTRKPGEFLIYEQPMDIVDIKNIKNVIQKKNTIKFNDTLNEYSFNISKSTLFKRFSTPATAYKIPISIIDDPFKLLEELLDTPTIASLTSHTSSCNSIMLPLYSFNREKGKYIPAKSGLNQWNANGRHRNEDELYIRIPIWIHRVFPDFLPPRDHCFDLKIPNGSILSAKLCQEASEDNPQWGKGLMSNPNSALGNWLLRQVLAIRPGELLTYEKLEQTGIDTVELKKINNKQFEIYFKEVGTFDDFEDNYI